MEPVRKNIMLGTAGHVDHGKTALVRLLTGCETDRLAEEKARGLTIEIGFAPCRMSDERIVGIVDVPGHVDFIRNMVAGAHGVDVVIFVIAADDGVMPQTREHLDILTLMGCRRGLVALTKIDLVDDELRSLAVDEVKGFLRGTFLDGAPVCPISNITGEGFDGFFGALNRAVAECTPRQITGPFKMWVERSFAVHGFGAVATGIPSTGVVAEGDRLHVVPPGAVGRARKLEVYGAAAAEGRAGECTAINVVDVEPRRLTRGSVLAESDAVVAAEYAEAELTILPSVPAALKDYLEVHVHVGTGEAMANLAVLNDRQLPPGQSRFVQLRLRSPLPVSPGERFVIRGSAAGLAGGRVTTLGGGTILSVSNLRLRRNRPWTIEQLAARAAAVGDVAAWSSQVLAEADEPIDAAELARRANLRVSVAREQLERLRQAGDAVAAGQERFVHRRRIAATAAALAEALAAWHAEQPMRMGLDAAALAAKVAAQPALAALAAEKLVGDGKAERHGELLRLRGAGLALEAADVQRCERITDVLRAAGFSPPSAAELAGELGVDEAAVRKLLRLLVEQQAAVDLGHGVTMHAEAVAAGQRAAVELLGRLKTFTTMDFRDALGVSRKFAVPLLDHLDATRWTVRNGNRRTAGALARPHLPA